MSLNVGIVSQNVPASAGNQTYTDSSFGGGIPKAAIFIITSARTNGGSKANATIGMGFTDGTNQTCIGCHSRGGRPMSECYRQLMNDQSIFFQPTILSVDGEASFVSFGTNSVTINWTNALGVSRILTVILLGGSDLVNVHVGTFTTPSTIDSSTDVTDPGFKPDQVLVLSAGGIAINNGAANSAGSSFNIGMCDNGQSIVQASYNFWEPGGVGTSAVNAILMNNRVMRKVQTGGVGAGVELGLFDSLGFSATTRDSAEASTCAYLALKYGANIRHNVGIADTPTSTGDEKRLFGFKPDLILQGMSFLSSENTLSENGDGGAFGVHAVYNGDELEASNSLATEDNQSTTDTQSLRDNQLDIPRHDGTTGLRAVLSSIEGETWTETWSDVDATARKFVWMSMGDEIPSISVSGNLFINGYLETETSGNLFIDGHSEIEISGNLFIHGYSEIETSGNLFIYGHVQSSANINLYLKAYEHNSQRHYIEDFRTWAPITKETWEEKDISAWIPDNANITAEIVVATSSTVDNNNYYVGVRTPGSVLDRKYNLAYTSSEGGYNSLTIHVQLSGGKLECYAPSGTNFFMLGYWIGTQYIELDGNFDGGTAGSWTNKDLNSFGVPSGAIVEFMVGAGWGGPQLGMRSVGSSADRVFALQMADHSSNLYTYWTSFIQTSGANAIVQYYSENYTWDHHFYIAGYWAVPPGDYTDVYQDEEANPINNGVWEAVDLSGVPSKSVASFGLVNKESDNSRFLGVRQSGTSIERKINLRKTSSSNWDIVQCWHVNIGSPIEAYSENATGIYDNLALLGYWDNFIDDVQNTNDSCALFMGGHLLHNTLDEVEYPSGVTMYISGILGGNIHCFIKGPSQEIASSTLWTHGPEQKIASGTLFISAPHLVGTSGVASGNPGVDTEYGGSSPDLFMSSPEFLNSSGNLFLKVPEPISSNIDLFLHVWNPRFKAHYIEDFRTWHVTTSGSWVEYDLSAYFPNVNHSIVAEILIANISSDTTWSGGVRVSGSVVDRRFNIRQDSAELGTDGSNNLTLHVQTSGGKIECFAENYNDIEFNLIGYWIGPHYTEASGIPIRPTFAAEWDEYDLISQGIPSGVVAEILTSTQSTNGYTLGVREVGSTISRWVPCNGGEGDGLGEKSFASTFVHTSGVNSTIEGWAPHTHANRHSFVPVGYWDVPPGDYTELYLYEAANPTINNVWENVNISGVPGNSVADFIFGNRKFSDRQWLGLRPTDKNLERKIHTADLDSFSTNGQASNRMHVNIDTASNVTVFAENAVDTDDHFNCLGYWDNFTEYPEVAVESVVLYTTGHGFETSEPTLFTHGCDSIDSSGQYPSGVSFFVYGVQLTDFDLHIHGKDTFEASGNLYIFGAYFYATDTEYSINYPSGLSCYTQGSGIIPESGQFNLVVSGIGKIQTSGDLFIDAHGGIVESGNLFLKVLEPKTGSINLIIYNPVDIGPGLIRTPQAVFYIRDYNDTNWTHEYVEDMSIYVPGIYFYPVEVISDSSATGTVGDGTLPLYNSLGKGFTSNQFGSSLIGTEPHKQNILGRVAPDDSYPDDNADYPYPGSGSITTAFWMSGANTIASGVYDEWGNVQVGTGIRIEAGWFRREGRFNYDVGQIGFTTPANTIGIEINGESGIIVRTSVRDMPYEQASGTGPYWGGTTHYGTPTGTTWSWNPEVDESYSAWNEEWPEVNIAHNNVAFFVLRSEFIASGVDGNAPNHMKVWLSVDGQPWVYIGSGLTGPPASSLYSNSNPTNRYTENAVGTKVRAINYQGGSSNVGSGWVGVTELAIWTDADKFTDVELSALYDLVPVYKRPLNEYRPTIVPPSTYIRRTVGSPIYTPIVPGEGYFGGEIGSGFLVTLEVGLGAYGEDASAYLLEEVPPSGFVIRNIQPHTDVRYTLQGTRPTTQQQIFHDPQSGIMQPYNNDLGVNTYSASIRWVNHDNHPQKDERRLPTPTGIYTYELYPVSYQDLSPSSEFEFSGSGLFFDGTTSSGVFLVRTTGDTSGTTDGVLGGIKIQGFNLYMRGPMPVSGTINLYLRTQETFTSAYIGTSPRTPEATDFIFMADGDAAIESMAGIEYGPPLYTKGPLQYENNCSLVIFGPIGDEITLHTHGSKFFSSSGDFPSGMLLKVGDGHEIFYGSGNLFVLGPVPYSGEMYMHTRAGAFEPPIDLFIWGYTKYAGAISGFIKGPEFICSSGDFDYPLDSTLFTFPSGGQSPNLYMSGPQFICSSGTFAYPGDPDIFTTPSGGQSPSLYMLAYKPASGICPLYIGPLRLREEWTLYLKTEDDSINNTVNLFTHGFVLASGESGVVQAFNNIPLYLEAADADYPYTAGGTNAWTLFLKTQDGNLIDYETWSMFLKADFTIPAICNLYTYGHASGEAPRGNILSDSVNFVCSVNPDDPRRIGFIPHDAHGDPWNLFLKCDPGHFNTTDLYMSGAAPVNYAASGNLFVEGLFEQETNTVPLYLMGISGMFNNGPSGLHLFLNVGILVYNTRGNLYIHGY